MQMPGTYLLKETLLMKVYSAKVIEDEDLKTISDSADFFSGQPIDLNADYGFHQLSEIAMKALSPGINDPGTAVISLHSLFALLEFRLYCKMPNLRKESNLDYRIFIPTSTFLEIFDKNIHPIWNYGKKDQNIQRELYRMLLQLKNKDHKGFYTNYFEQWLSIVEQEIQQNKLPYNT